MELEIKQLPYDLTVCKVESLSDVNLDGNLFFIGKTDEELSLVCEAQDAPERTVAREDGWRAFRIEGVLDFSLIGILSKVSSAGIGIFAVSTYNTDYVLVKADDFDRAADALALAGYRVE